jgi:alpha-glucosidase
MVADYPSAYRGHPGLAVLARIPTTWDDTRVLSGVVGRGIVVARRLGEEWWVGAMTDREARDAQVPLDFLGPGRFKVELYRDDLAAEHRLAIETKDVTSADAIRARLAPAGGLLVHIAPLAR